MMHQDVIFDMLKQRVGRVRGQNVVNTIEEPQGWSLQIVLNIESGQSMSQCGPAQRQKSNCCRSQASASASLMELLSEAPSFVFRHRRHRCIMQRETVSAVL